MGQITRRHLLGGSGVVLGLAACKAEAPALQTPQTQAIYQGTASFEHGVASGDPLPDAVILWTRITPDDAFADIPIPFRYDIFSDEALTQIVTGGQGLAGAGNDYTIKIDAGSLAPDQVYYYRFLVKTQDGEITSPVGRTKTTATSGNTPVKLAAISCSNYPFGHFHVYRDIAETPGLDAVIHLGDYLYEYGIDGYGGSVGREIGRNHTPPLEIITLSDYRSRHAQYKTDPDLQAAHAAAPWLCTWDDHESANDAYRTGAQNHNPEQNEGNWSDRKQAAVQAYLEWMPIRDPVPGLARENIYRRFDFGDVASILCLDSRLTGRSEEISWFTEIGGLEWKQALPAALATMQRVIDPDRTMLGAVQEAWLENELDASAKSGKTWQVLANQVVMAKVIPPKFKQTLTDEQIAAQDVDYVRQLIDFSQLSLPWNLDAWDGFPAARDRLYQSAKQAGANLVTLTGDTHTAWANTLYDSSGEQRGVEFGSTSVSSPGFGQYMKQVDDIGEQFADTNKEVEWYDPNGNGWTLVTLTANEAKADYYKVSDVTLKPYSVSKAASFSSRRNGASLTPLSRV